ncbi:MAG: hypothetical protein Q8S57_06520 [Methanoregula sp.]|nr:hypothetical protein [Methanoregula sp.]
MARGITSFYLVHGKYADNFILRDFRQKRTGIILLFVCIAPMILIAGCMSQSTAQTPSTDSIGTTDQTKEDLVTLDSFECKPEKKNLLYCKGVVKNDDTRSHSVMGYIDVYDSNDIKYDYMMFNVKVDAKCKTSFEKMFTEVEKHPNSTFMYYIYSVK